MPWNSDRLETVKIPSEVILPMPDILPVLDMSQSLVLISPVSPLSPKMNLPLVWKLPEILALLLKETLGETRKVYEAEEMVRLASRVRVFCISSKSIELDEGTGADQVREPLPLVFKTWLVEPSAEGKE